MDDGTNNVVGCLFALALVLATFLAALVLGAKYCERTQAVEGLDGFICQNGLNMMQGMLGLIYWLF
jgi:hypothetical protein